MNLNYRVNDAIVKTQDSEGNNVLDGNDLYLNY